jgi:hypothetical protein
MKCTKIKVCITEYCDMSSHKRKYIEFDDDNIDEDINKNKINKYEENITKLNNYILDGLNKKK